MLAIGAVRQAPLELGGAMVVLLFVVPGWLRMAIGAMHG
jgi:hypothetical protein